MEYGYVSDISSETYVACSVIVETGELGDCILFVANANVTVDTHLSSIVNSVVLVSVASTLSLSDYLQEIYSGSNAEVLSINNSLYNIADVHYDANPLNDFSSNLIGFSYSRYVEESRYKDADFYGIPLRIEDYFIHNDASNIVSFSRETLLSNIKDTKFFNIFSFLLYGGDDNKRVFIATTFGFGIDKKPNIIFIERYLSERIIEAYSYGGARNSIIGRNDFYSFEFLSVNSKAAIISEVITQYLSMDWYADSVYKYSSTENPAGMFYPDAREEVSISSYNYSGSIMSPEIEVDIHRYCFIGTTRYENIITSKDDYSIIYDKDAHVVSGVSFIREYDGEFFFFLSPALQSNASLLSVYSSPAGIRLPISEYYDISGGMFTVASCEIYGEYASSSLNDSLFKLYIGPLLPTSSALYNVFDFRYTNGKEDLSNYYYEIAFINNGAVFDDYLYPLAETRIDK
jgi:hypothetical protein